MKSHEPTIVGRIDALTADLCRVASLLRLVDDLPASARGDVLALARERLGDALERAGNLLTGDWPD